MIEVRSCDVICSDVEFRLREHNKSMVDCLELGLQGWSLSLVDLIEQYDQLMIYTCGMVLV